MKYFFTILTIAAFLFFSDSAFGRSFRPGQIPNGNINKCANCHINPQGGGPRNPFGKEVEANFLKNGDVQWGPELAMLDSDGDGFTNGEELQDPNGEWQIGDPDPGDPEMVFLPGDPESKPNTNGLIEDLVTNTSLNIYPNPFFDEMTFTAELPNVTVSSAEIFDIFGNLIKNIDVDNISNNVLFKWNGLDNDNTGVPSGIYFLRVRINNVDITRKVVLSR